MWSAPDRSCLWNGMCVRCRSWCRSSAMRSWLSGSSASFSPQVEARLSVTASTQNPGAILLRFSIASTRCTVARSGMPSLLLRAIGDRVLRILWNWYLRAVGGTEGVTADLRRHSRCANWYRQQAPPTQLGPRSPDEFRSCVVSVVQHGPRVLKLQIRQCALRDFGLRFRT